MSILRLSTIKNTVYAPDADGMLDMRPYSHQRKTGQMETLAEPNWAKPTSDLRRYLEHQTQHKAAKIGAQPLLIMVHGFLFDPRQTVSPQPEDTDNPHSRLYHFLDGDQDAEIRHHTSSWPRWMGFDADDHTGKTGLAVAFGWQSQPGFASSLIEHFQNFYSRAYEMGGHAAWVLANTIAHLAELQPGKPIDFLCHSLGSRVVIRAIALIGKHRPELINRLGQVIILGGAEYVVEAQLMMRRLYESGAKNLPSFYNIVSRENDVLDKLGENFGPRTFGNTNVIGHNGLDVKFPGGHWIDLQIDKAQMQEWMKKHKKLNISGDQPGNVWDHWYYYTYRDNMALYHAILRDRKNWSIAALRKAGVPEGVSRRWSIFGTD